VSGSSHPLPAVTPLRLVSQAVSVRFGAVAAVIEVSADIEPGERVLVTGRAASGKSTWLKCLAGLQRPSSGVVRWDLQDVSTLSIEARRQQQRSFGMVFQSDALFDSMTVLENVCLPLTRRQMPADQARATAEEALARVGLTAAKDRRPEALSGGMKKRVGVARAIVARPSILLADDPFAGLDPDTERAIGALLLEVSQGRTLVAALPDPVPLWSEHGAAVSGVRSTRRSHGRGGGGATSGSAEVGVEGGLPARLAVGLRLGTETGAARSLRIRALRRRAVWLRRGFLRRLPSGESRRILLQRQGVVPVVHQPSRGGDGSATGGATALGAAPAVDVESALQAALPGGEAARTPQTPRAATGEGGVEVAAGRRPAAGSVGPLPRWGGRLHAVVRVEPSSHASSSRAGGRGAVDADGRVGGAARAGHRLSSRAFWCGCCGGRRRTSRTWKRHGLSDEYEAAQREALQRPLGLELPPSPPRRRVAVGAGFSLHADTAVHGNDRQGLERLCRYGARGPVSESRLRRLEDGRYQYTPKKGVTFTLTAKGPGAPPGVPGAERRRCT